MLRWKRILVRMRRAIRKRRAIALALTIIPPLIVTVLSYTTFHLAADRKYFDDIADQALGTRMDLFADTREPRAGAHRILVLDYDDETSRELDDPVLVPPEIVARALTGLARQRPWAVVVDIDLAYVGNPAALPAVADDTVRVEALRRAIGALAATGTLVVLARETLPDEKDGIRLRASALDDFVARTPRVMWGTTAVSVGQDRVVRRIWPTRIARLGGGNVILPSVPLVLKLLVMDKSSDRIDRVVAEGLAGASTCGNRDAGELVFCTRSGPYAIDTRRSVSIDYSVSWKPPSARERDRAPKDVGITYASIRPLALGEDSIDPALFRNSLILIGATAGRRDIRATPLDDPMPGVYVQANAARDWIELGPSHGSFLKGLVLTICAALLLTLLAMALIRMVPAEHAGRLRQWLPALLTGALWAGFLGLGNPAASVGLVVTAYLVVSTVIVSSDVVARLGRPGDEERSRA